MRIGLYVLVLAVSAVVTFGLSFLVWRLSIRFRLTPQIRARDVHTRPTPRLGGVAMFLGMVVAFLVAWSLPQFHLVFLDPKPVFGLLAASFLIVLVGALDDLLDLDWALKLAMQIAAAGILAWSGIQLYTLPIGGVLIGDSWVSLILTVLVVVLVMNAVNFIDGLDGLVAGVATIASGVFFVYVYLLQFRNETSYFNLSSLATAILIGACLGFLPLNWRPAKLFMGDAGALLVGLVMAATTISVTGHVDTTIAQRPTVFSAYFAPAFIPLLLPIAVLLVPLTDLVLAVVRRVSAGRSPFAPDRKHLHHRLLDLGHSHLGAVLIFYAWTFAASVGVLLFMFVPWWGAVIFLVLAFVACVVLTLLPVARRRRAAASGVAE